MNNLLKNKAKKKKKKTPDNFYQPLLNADVYCKAVAIAASS